MTIENEASINEKPKVGDLLKQGRLRQRLSIVECAKRTHISPRYLEALEEERWDDLPSASHRVGFLRLYARFLGVAAEDVVGLYQREIDRQPRSEPATPRQAKPAARKTETKSSLYPASMGQLAAMVILGLILAWGIYHAVKRQLPEHSTVPLVRLRSHQVSPRLVAPKPVITAQKVRVHADADTWLRVVTESRLLFEGILPAGATKEWSGQGPFEIKIGNVKGLSVFWNDQPVDVQANARGGINELRLPLSK